MIPCYATPPSFCCTAHCTGAEIIREFSPGPESLHADSGPRTIYNEPGHDGPPKQHVTVGPESLPADIGQFIDNGPPKQHVTVGPESLPADSGPRTMSPATTPPQQAYLRPTHRRSRSGFP